MYTALPTLPKVPEVPLGTLLFGVYLLIMSISTCHARCRLGPDLCPTTMLLCRLTATQIRCSYNALAVVAATAPVRRSAYGFGTCPTSFVGRN